MSATHRLALLLSCLGVSAAGCLKIPEDFPEEPGGKATAPTTVAEVLDHHVRAIGGEAKLRTLRSRTVEARVVFHAEEGCPPNDETCIREEQTGSFFLQSTADGKLYRRTVVGDLVEERGFDGEIGWTLHGGTTLRIDAPDELALSREDALLHWYFDVDARGVEAALLGSRREDSEGHVIVLDGIGWRIAEGPTKQLWFDRETGLLREELVSEGEGDDATMQVIRYEDYRPVDGVLVPHLVRVSNQFGERKQVLDFITQRVHHEPVDEAKFAVPELPDPEPVPDPLLDELDKAAAAAKAEPKDAASQMEWARLAFVAGHFEEALTALQATLALEPREPEALFTLARVQVMMDDLDAARKTIARAKKAGVKPEVLARQEAWISHRTRAYASLAKSLDLAGNPVLAGHYRSFVGKPLGAELEGNACVVRLPMASKGPLVVVPIRIGDQETAAILDTGAADVILTEKLAKALQVNVRARSSMGPNAPQIGHGQVDSVKAGALTLHNVPVNVYGDQEIADMAGEDAARVGAVLGIGALRDFQVTVDAPAGEVVLVAGGGRCRKDREARRKGPGAPLWLHETHYLYVLGRMNGAEGIYLVNTGMRGADMTANQQAYAYAGIGTPPLRANEAPMVKVETFEIPGVLTVKDATSAFGYFEARQTNDGFRLDGMLGMGVLDQKPFTIDFETRRLYVHGG